jgi:hypothetical protein
MRTRIQLCNLNADPDPGSQTNADSDLVPGPTYVTASEFLNEKYTYLILVILIDHKTYRTYVSTKVFLKG